jgi:hypothetical protein
MSAYLCYSKSADCTSALAIDPKSIEVPGCATMYAAHLPRPRNTLPPAFKLNLTPAPHLNDTGLKRPGRITCRD